MTVILFCVPQILTTHAMEEADHLCTRIGMCPNTCSLGVRAFILLMGLTGCVLYSLVVVNSSIRYCPHTHAHTRYNELWSPALSGHTDTPEDSVRHRLPAAVPLRPGEGPAGGELHQGSAAQGHPHGDLRRWACVAAELHTCHSLS